MASNPPIQPPPPPPPYPTAPQATPQGVPPTAPQKKTSPWIWVLIGCGGLLLLVLILLAAAGFWGFRKAKEIVGAKNPAVAAARLVAAANPDIEVVESDDDAGTITLRNKKTGEVITMNAEDIKKGKISFKNEKGEEVTFEGEGKGSSGSLKITSKEGQMKFGAGNEAELPDWVPHYPGAVREGAVSGTTKDGTGGSFGLTTSDSAAKVMTFFKDELEGAGFEVNVTTFEKSGKQAGGTLSAEDKGTNRTVHVIISTEDGKTQAAVTFAEKLK